MMKLAFVFTSLLIVTTIYAQVDSDKLIAVKKLSWSDFTGEVDKS